MRLSGWQRVGIVVSIVWAIGAAIYLRNAHTDQAQTLADWAYKTCVDSNARKKNNDLKDCSRERETARAESMEGSWRDVAFLSLVPIPFAWLFGFILINVGRAQVIGFRAVLPWATLTLPKKLFVGFCIFASGAAILFIAAAFLNLYVDTRVPVTLGYRAMVTQFGNDLVFASGTWTREGSVSESETRFPLQTSRITCYRQERRCSEARADISFGNLLSADLVEYEIESWGDTTIVFREDGICISTVYTIDRKTESVNGMGRFTNMDTRVCGGATQGTWTFRLTDGFKVYWEERKKARPLPLRLIHTLFGN